MWLVIRPPNPEMIYITYDDEFNALTRFVKLKKFEVQQKREKVDFDIHTQTKNLLEIVTSERDALKSRIALLNEKGHQFKPTNTSYI